MSAGWQPIETAPKNGEQRIIIAEIVNGELRDLDFDAVLEQEQESWELPQPYWVWVSAYGRVENPTHWMPLPDVPKETNVCSNCGAEITEELRTPEMNTCSVCLNYRQDYERRQAVEEEMVQVTREMAKDGGCPEMEGRWIIW